MTVDRKALRERALAATPGNWSAIRPPNDSDGWATGSAVASVGRGAMVYTDHRGGVHPAADQAYIAAHGPRATIALLDELDRADIALSDVGDRIATIASEAFGPFPVQSAEQNLTAIEQGIAKLRSECERWRAVVKLVARCKPLASASEHDSESVTVREGDATWHDGPGWYYTIDDYPDEGSCGAFASRTLAEQHARIAGFVVEPREPNADEQRKAGA